MLPESWQRLPSSGDTEGACCLFVSSSALFPLERYVTAERREGAKKEQHLPAVDAPCFHPSIHFPPSSSNNVFITCGERRLCYRLFALAGFPRTCWSVTNVLVSHSSTLHGQRDCVKGFLSMCLLCYNYRLISVTQWRSRQRASSSCTKDL